MAAGERPDHTATLARHTLVYGLSGFVVPLVGLVTLPIYARAFSPAELGLLELGMVLVVVTLVLADSGLSTAARACTTSTGPSRSGNATTSSSRG